MAGGVLKGFGITFIVLASLLMVAGVAAAAYGAYILEENGDQLFRDGDADDTAQGLLIGGGVAFAIGVVLLVLGLSLNAAGNGRRHRELLMVAAGRSGLGAETAATAATTAATAPAPAAPPKPATPAPAPARKNHAVIGVAVALALLLAVIGLVILGNGGGVSAFQDEEPGFQPLDFDGFVRQAFSLPVAGSMTAETADSQQEFDAPAGARQLHLELSWTAADGGAEQLRVIVEMQSGSSWVEVGRSGGDSPATVDVALSGAEHLRYRVFPDGDASAVVEQPFHVHVGFA